MESDSDVCCEPAVATGRCGRQLVIVDDDSRDGDESSVANTVEILDINHVIADNAREAASRQQNQYTGDDLFSEDSGSLEALLDKLTLKPSKEADEDIGILDDEQSLGSEEESSDSENEDDEDVDTDDPGSAWCFDQGTQEYFLSKRKVSDVAWPGLRLPKHVFSSLYDHQKTGIQWMAQRHAEGVGGILGDDMGM
jgi:SNF2 family DNA or RNA helicase